MSAEQKTRRSDARYQLFYFTLLAIINATMVAVGVGSAMAIFSNYAFGFRQALRYIRLFLIN